MNDPNLVIVLKEPQGPLNIGAVCRVMMNFGVARLRLVNPCKAFRSLEARKMALGTVEILENAEVYPDLHTALADIHLTFGTTRRFGKYRKNFLTPATAARQIAQSGPDVTCALLLGREDTGLETRDLDLCQRFVTIPTHDAYPSMNLSHALAVLLYEVSLKSRLTGTFHDPGPKQPASGKEMENLYAHMRKTLVDIEFLDPQNPDHLLRTFRRLFGDAGLSPRDVRILQGLMSRIDWTENQRRKLAAIHQAPAPQQDS
ncbi:MAG TPA: RNA methyltransferase [Desulfotignum sp.]|nr:RNA methyltransferase [Desulfotignum sp.]